MVKPKSISREFTQSEVVDMLNALVPFEHSLVSYTYLFGGLSTTTIKVTIEDANLKIENSFILKIFFPNDPGIHVIQNAMNICHMVHQQAPEVPITCPVFSEHVRIVNGFKCILMNYISDSIAGDVAVEEKGIPRKIVLGAMGKVLAQLHSVKIHAEYEIPSYKSGGAVDLFQHERGDFVEKIRKLGNAEFSKFYEQELIESFSILSSNEHSLPQGILHGDPFIDNIMISDTPTSELTGLVDFEDACRGPVIFDLASTIAGSCFLTDSEIDWESVSVFFTEYQSIRPLTPTETSSIYLFIRVAIMCNCAFRFMMYCGKPTSEAYRDLYLKLKYMRSEEDDIRHKLASAIVG